MCWICRAGVRSFGNDRWGLCNVRGERVRSHRGSKVVDLFLDRDKPAVTADVDATARWLTGVTKYGSQAWHGTASPRNEEVAVAPTRGRSSLAWLVPRWTTTLSSTFLRAPNFLGEGAATTLLSLSSIGCYYWWTVEALKEFELGTNLASKSCFISSLNPRRHGPTRPHPPADQPLLSWR
jgi:hypothetical protein